ncbi:2-dehydro-3-deoxygalactonokinase [Aliiroseovarius sp. YM-037]|uniref:2-dehydro-3-deoxygalactonokinase n=1 Tax=Aliiroseovarius sp. YM-037 TaxID=3341728 RepID=UPI003A80044D
MTDSATTYADWIAVDWGSSNLRAWAMTVSGTHIASAESAHGAGTLAREAFEAALLDLITPWLSAEKTSVIACGMVGSRQGWVEAPYATTPCPALSGNLVKAPVSHPQVDVFVIPGIRQTSPADVMRGEETQIAGFLALNPNWDGVICLPGTHTKWAHVSAGEVVSFQTFLTGELFATISKQTVLRHTVAADGWNDDAFHDALSNTISKPEQIAARLFSLRAESLLNDLDGASARARLSGTLIGAELAAARPYWLGQQVAILGAQSLAETYKKALETQGVPITLVDASRMTLAGLSTAYSQLKETA